MLNPDRNLKSEDKQVKENLIEPGGNRDVRDSGGNLADSVEIPDLNTDNVDDSEIVSGVTTALSVIRMQPAQREPTSSQSSTSSIFRCCGLFNRSTYPYLIAFWILGLCNNYGYVVMLSAAHDIIKEHSPPDTSHTYVPQTNQRDCNRMSTGAILLADVVPSLSIKVFAAFLPLCIRIRVTVIVVLSIMGFLIVASSSSQMVVFVGVACTSFASGLGEATFVAYMSFFGDKGVIGFWCSGTGAAGLAGAMGYAVPTSLGASPDAVLYFMTSVPLLMAFLFFSILQNPDGRTNTAQIERERSNFQLRQKLKFLPNLFGYMIPIGLVYLFEYLINQGLFELLHYEDTFLTHDEQYRWYQVLYQLGVLISRSSIGLIRINYLTLLAVFQGVNLILLFLETLYFFLPNMIIVMVIISWEGLLGGASYVNTLYKMNIEVAEDKREFSMGVVTLSDAIGITTAGILSIPLHNWICDLPKY